MTYAWMRLQKGWTGLGGLYCSWSLQKKGVKRQ